MEHLDEGTVHAWLDGALSEEEGRRIEEHASSCSECSALIAEARGLIAASSRILSALDDVPRVQRPEAKAPTSASVSEALRDRTRQSASPSMSQTVDAPALRIEHSPSRAPRRAWWARPQLSAAAVLAVVALGSFVVARNRGSAIPADLRVSASASAPVADSAQVPQSAPLAASPETRKDASPQPVDALAPKEAMHKPSAPSPTVAGAASGAEALRRDAPKAAGTVASAPNDAKKDAVASNVAVTVPPIAPPIVAAKAVSDSTSSLAAREATVARRAAAPAPAPPASAVADAAQRPDTSARARQEGEAKKVSRSLDPNQIANIEKRRIQGEPQLRNVVTTGAASSLMVRATDVFACWSLQRTAAAITAGVPQHIELTNRVVGKELGNDVYAARIMDADKDKSESWRWSIGAHGDVVLMRGSGDAIVRIPLSTTGTPASAEVTPATRQSCGAR